MLCMHYLSLADNRFGKLDNVIMKDRLSTVKNRKTESQAFFIIFKLPLLLITPILGFIIEFLYELPFMLVCLLDSRLRK
jgi:hypothetical protein